MRKQNKAKKTLNWLRTSVWAFPLVLVIILSLFTALKIHGSSIGVYHNFLYGEQVDDPDLIYGHPKTIRSDEWLISTQRASLQVESGSPAFNELIGTGRDISRAQDIPISDWITTFKPQTWGFFVMPFENAFALKWWFSLFLLAGVCYFFILKFLPRRKTFAILLSVSFALSPFLLWWYQATLFLSMSYALLIIFLAMRVIDQEKLPRVKSMRLANIFYLGALAYLGVCYGFLFYPPFLISIMLVILAVLLGYIAQKIYAKKLSAKRALKRMSLFIIPILIVLCLGLLYVSQHKEMINAVSSTEYPGKRISKSGDMPMLGVFDGFLMPFLQGAERGVNYYGNQSGASNFILLLPFLIIPSIFLMAREYLQKRKLDFVFIAINLLALMFLARAFIPFGDSFYNLLLLDRVPNQRMVAGMGLLGLIQIIYLAKKFGTVKNIGKDRLSIMLAATYSLLCLVALSFVGRFVADKYPKFASEYWLIGLFALMFASIIFLLLINRKVLAVSLLLVFTAGSTFKILPLYRGLDFLEESRVIKNIQMVSTPEDDWIVLDSIIYENLPLAAGRGSIGGSQPYPDLDFWSQLGNGKYKKAYNRQAHAVFVADRSLQEDIILEKRNVFKVKFECSNFIYRNVDFVLSTKQINYQCAELAQQVRYPKVNFFVYKIVQ